MDYRVHSSLITRGVTPIGAVSRAAIGIKMQSKGQGTFWGSVKRSSGVLGPHVYGACAVCRCVLVRIYGGVFMRDSGRSL